jgi:hypothetical protein
MKPFVQESLDRKSNLGRRSQQRPSENRWIREFWIGDPYLRFGRYWQLLAEIWHFKQLHLGRLSPSGDQLIAILFMTLRWWLASAENSKIPFVQLIVTGWRLA